MKLRFLKRHSVCGSMFNIRTIYISGSKLTLNLVLNSDIPILCYPLTKLINFSTYNLCNVFKYIVFSTEIMIIKKFADQTIRTIKNSGFKLMLNSRRIYMYLTITIFGCTNAVGED